jgi:hypothetical protein
MARTMSLKAHTFPIIVCMITGCAATAGANSAFVEWQGFGLATAKPPPSDYRLDGNDEYCRPWPLSECTYRNGGFTLSYHDGLLISKEAIVADVSTGDPLVNRLADAGGERQVLNILREQGLAGYPPDCFDVDGAHYCGVVVNADPSVFLQARFSSGWELISISFNVPDAL